MHGRRSKHKRADGTERIDVSIAQNVRVKGANGQSVAKPVILAHLGSAEHLDDPTIDEMVALLQRMKTRRAAERAAAGKPESAMEAAEGLRREIRPRVATLRTLASKRFGMRMVVEAAWNALGLDALLNGLAEAAHVRVAVERMIFAMVWNRLEAPTSKRGCADWLQEEAWMPEAADWDADRLYRAMDFLFDHRGAVMAHLRARALAAEPGDACLPFCLDTTTAFTEADMDDFAVAARAEAWLNHQLHGAPAPEEPLPQVVNNPPLRVRGHSKDGHPESPQIVLGLATSGSGAVLSYKLMAGNTSDKAVTLPLVQSVRADLPGRPLLVVMDAGMASQAHLRALHAEGAGWLSGLGVRKNRLVTYALEDPTSWTALARTSHRNRTPKVSTWESKLVDVPTPLRAVPTVPERVLLLRNPDRARRDVRKLENLVSDLQSAIARNNAVESDGRPNPVFRRAALKGLYRIEVEAQKVVVDEAAIARERQFAGVRALRTTDTTASADALVTAYQQLLATEDDFRTLKSTLEIRPFWHRARDRIEAHVVICLIAMAMIRHVESATGQSWREVTAAFTGVVATELASGSATWWQRTELRPAAVTILGKLGSIPGYERWTSDAMLPVRRAKEVE